MSSWGRPLILAFISTFTFTSMNFQFTYLPVLHPPPAQISLSASLCSHVSHQYYCILFHCSIFQLLNSCYLWPQLFHLSYFPISTKPFSPSLPSYAPPWSPLIWLTISSDFTNFMSPFWQCLVFTLGAALSHPRFPYFFPHKPWFTALFPPPSLRDTVGYRHIKLT